MSKVGEFRVIPSGIKTFLVGLQKNVYFETDVVVKITNTIYDSNHVFGTLQEEYYLPHRLKEIPNSEISFDYNETKEYFSDLPF